MHTYVHKSMDIYKAVHTLSVWLIGLLLFNIKILVSSNTKPLHVVTTSAFVKRRLFIRMQILRVFTIRSTQLVAHDKLNIFKFILYMYSLTISAFYTYVCSCRIKMKLLMLKPHKLIINFNLKMATYNNSNSTTQI